MNIMLLIVCVASFAIASGGDRHRGAGAGDLQRRDGLQPGAEGPGQRRGAGPAAGAAGAGAAIRPGRGDRVDRSSCPVTSCCSRRGTSSRRTAGSSSPPPSRCRRPRSPARARPWPKDRRPLPEGDIALGDRTNLVFQNTQVTRGSATFVVTATGQATADGPDRRHGDRDQALPLAAAAGARRHDQGVRPRSPGWRWR